MTERKPAGEKDRLKDRSDIGVVISPIDKLMKFRDANASCVHIEAALEADRGLTETGKSARSETGRNQKRNFHHRGTESRRNN